MKQRAHQLSAQRQKLFKTVPEALASKQFNVAFESIGRYQRELRIAGLYDAQTQEMLEDANAKESEVVRKQKLIKLSIKVTGVVLVLITVLVIKDHLYENALQRAVSRGDWETALEIDPKNSSGLQLRRAAIMEALGNGDWQAVLELDPYNTEGLRLQSLDAFERARSAKDHQVSIILSLQGTNGAGA